jgi:hypothetical protein
MGMREELLRDALEEFIDRLPDEIRKDEAAWIIFNIVGSRDLLEEWGSISRLTTANIAEYFLHQAFGPEVEAARQTEEFLDKIMKEHKTR